MVRLYMKMKIFHTLKQSNVQIKEGKAGKCNRKMLKLNYFFKCIHCSVLYYSNIYMSKYEIIKIYRLNY